MINHHYSINHLWSIHDPFMFQTTKQTIFLGGHWIMDGISMGFGLPQFAIDSMAISGT